MTPVAQTVYWLGAMWVLGLVVTVAAVYVMQIGYRVDSLQNQYTSLMRQNQAMAVTVSQLTSPSMLQRDAARLHVRLEAPMLSSASPGSATAKSTAGHGSLMQAVYHVFQSLRRALVGR
jgi:hypothetical protein